MDAFIWHVSRWVEEWLFFSGLDDFERMEFRNGMNKRGTITRKLDIP